MTLCQAEPYISFIVTRCAWFSNASAPSAASGLPCLTMSLPVIWKIPLLLFATLLVHNATISPNPRPKTEAVSRFTKRDTIAGIVNWVPVINMAVLWSAAFAEIGTVLAEQQSSPLLSLLIVGPPSLARNIAVSPLFLAGWLLATLGSTFRITCFRHLGRQFTYDLSIVDGHKLITDGPYSIVRHPSYTAWTLLTIGTILMHMSPGSWVAECGPLRTLAGRVFAALYTIFNAYIIAMLFPRMKREDEVLKAQFGDQWVQWTKRTPYRFFPGIYYARSLVDMCF
ncbi:hypothetical protein OH77DRAFT_1223058 [Trametes cingulata]|nr:hypothetical protein OH77DRAFT_1223058 [Trametes cingulata]